MRSSRPVAAKCCWWTSCPASARPRWSIVRAEASRERGGDRIRAVRPLPVSDMMRLSNLTLRNVLIATHDALATTVALVASLYLRFEGDAFFDRLPLLLQILPWFVAFGVVVCYAFNLTTTKWRFISLPDALNILRAATVLALALLVLDYV